VKESTGVPQLPVWQGDRQLAPTRQTGSGHGQRNLIVDRVRADAQIHQDMDPTPPPTRRQFLTAAATIGAAVLVPRPLRARSAPRTLDFRHTHTGERLLGVEYFSGLGYVPSALDEVNHLLRDWRTDEIHVIDPDLLDLLHNLARVTGTQAPFEIISAYRSPATNAMLRAHSRKVSSNSLHMRGQAIDIRLPDVSLSQLRRAALGLRRGGVGYYPASNFVHVDTGRVRTW